MKENHSLIAEGLIDNVPDAIIALDPDGSVLLWSRGTSEMFGYSKEEAQRQSLSDLVIPFDRLSEEKENLGMVLTTDTHICESLRRRKDGSLINLDTSTRVVRDENGEVLYLLSTTKDVTHLKVIRAAHLIEAKFRDLLESTPDGYSREELIGELVELLVGIERAPSGRKLK